MFNSIPVVLVIAGHDPSGGAGIQADIQTISSLGCHPAVLITALTVQDTRKAYDIMPVPTDLLDRQMRAVTADFEIAAVKTGTLATVEIAQCVASWVDAWREIPLIVDPVLVAAGGGSLAEPELARFLAQRLTPAATVLTPNHREIAALAPDADGPVAAAKQLVATGAEHVLLTGADESTATVDNVLVGRDGVQERYSWPRLPGSYHGSGCTLAAAIAALMARGQPVAAAVATAQQYTFDALRNAIRPGHGQSIPYPRTHS